MSDRPDEGLLDTCVFIDLRTLDSESLPRSIRVSSITFAELGMGIAMAATPVVKALRTEHFGAANAVLDPLPFDADAARRFTTIAELVVAAGRNPKPRKNDLMIAAIASVNGLPLYTRNSGDFIDLEQVLTVVSV